MKKRQRKCDSFSEIKKEDAPKGKHPLLPGRYAGYITHFPAAVRALSALAFWISGAMQRLRKQWVQ